MSRPYRHWDREEVLRTIKALAARGEKLNSAGVARFHSGLAYAGRRFFGSWQKAIEAAGLDYGRIRRKGFWTRARITAQIKALKKAGKPLNVSAAEVHSAALVGAASVYFGSWRRAVEAAGYDYARIKRQKEWSKPEIVREIKRMNKEGINLSTTIPVRAKYRNLHAAAIRYFGAWAAAMKAAGLGKLYRRPL